MSTSTEHSKRKGDGRSTRTPEAPYKHATSNKVPHLNEQIQKLKYTLCVVNNYTVACSQHFSSNVVLHSYEIGCYVSLIWTLEICSRILLTLITASAPSLAVGDDPPPRAGGIDPPPIGRGTDPPPRAEGIDPPTTCERICECCRLAPETYCRQRLVKPHDTQ